MFDEVEALLAKRRQASGWYNAKAMATDSNALFRQFGKNASRILLGDADHRLDQILAEQAEYDAG